MSDKAPSESDRSGLSVPMFTTDDKTRQTLQAASSLFNVPQISGSIFPPALLHQSLAAVAFQQMVNQQPRQAIFSAAPPFFGDGKGSSHPFSGLAGFPTIPQTNSVGPSVFSSPPVIKSSPQTMAPIAQSRSHISSSPSPGLPARSPQVFSGAGPTHASSTPTLIVNKQQQTAGLGSSQPQQKVSSQSRHSTVHQPHSTEAKSRLPTSDMSPVVIASSSASSGVRLLASAPYQMPPPSIGGLPFPSSSASSGQPRLVPIQQTNSQGQNDITSVNKVAQSSSAGRQNLMSSHSSSSSGSGNPVRQTAASQGIGVPPNIPVVKISPAGNEQAVSTQTVSGGSKISRSGQEGRGSEQSAFQPTNSGSGMFFAPQPSMIGQNAPSAMKSFSGQIPQASSRVPWSPLVHPTYPHSRPVVPVGGGGTAIVAENDMSNSGQHGVSSRPGILRKRPIGEVVSNTNVTTQSPRRIQRLPPSIGHSTGSLSQTSSAPQMVAYMPSVSASNTISSLTSSSASSIHHGAIGVSSNTAPVTDSGFVQPTALNRESSASSGTSQLVKSELAESVDQPPARKKPRKQQLLPRSGNDNLMTHFDPLNTISQLPTVQPSSGSSAPAHPKQHKHSSAAAGSTNSSGSASSTAAVSTPVKEEVDITTPEPEVSEDDRKMTALVSGELSEFVDSEGVRWFSIRDSGRNGESKANKNSATVKYQQSPGPKLSSFYRCTWRVRNNHFERHSDVRAKDERCPALSEFCVAARSHVSREAAGWRIIQFLTLMDDQIAVENNFLDSISENVEIYRTTEGFKYQSSTTVQEGNSAPSTGSASQASSASKRGRGGANRLSGLVGASRQSARTRQQLQQQTTGNVVAGNNVPFEYTQLPDMFSELNRRLKSVSSSIQSLFSAHVPIAHQLLDRYAPIKTPVALKNRASSCSSSATSSSSPPSGDSLPQSPTPSSGNKDNARSGHDPTADNSSSIVAINLSANSSAPSKDSSSANGSGADVVASVNNSHLPKSHVPTTNEQVVSSSS